MKKMTKVRNFLVRMLFYVKAEPIKSFSPRMFSKTDKVYASAKHSVIRDMCVDPDKLDFTLAQNLFLFFKRIFSTHLQRFSSKWRRNCRKQPQSGVKRPLIRSYDLFSGVTIGRGENGDSCK